MAALITLVPFAWLVAYIAVRCYRSRPLWRVRYFQGKHKGPVLPFDKRPHSIAMDWYTANDYAIIFGGTVERVPK
jgi:hypothetical protein